MASDILAGGSHLLVFLVSYKYTETMHTVEWKIEHTSWGHQHWILDPLQVVATVLGSGPKIGMTIGDSCLGSMVAS